jgi:phage gp16-like protein
MSHPAPPRNADLAKIHVAKKQLGISDEDYRAMLWAQARVTSAKDLDHVGRAKVLAHLERLGFKAKASPTTKRPQRPTPAPEKLKLVRRIRAQLISLGRLPDTYADSIAKQMFGVDFYEWCTPEQLHKVSAALGVQQGKKGTATA